MGIIFKSFFLVAFVSFVYFTSDSLISMALSYGLPQLPINVAYFVSKSGLDSAISTYISIISAGWIMKQLLAYIRTFG